MPSLTDLQGSVARALTSGECGSIGALLLGGADPDKRLEIHVRHYETSLTAALRDKFAACAWLVGPELVDAAARAYVRARPPGRPCIAEYGDDFPQFLANHGRVHTIPYLESFAALEWLVGEVSIAVDHPPLSWSHLAQLGSERLIDSALTLQPGVRYLSSAWGVDQLMNLYLTGTEPERFVLAEADTFVEVRGARGAVSLARLEVASFVFRRKLAAGGSIGAAADGALKYDASFDPGEALQLLAHAGLIAETTFIGVNIS